MSGTLPTSVKVYTSNMPGSPTLTGAPGSTIGVLDACLVNGFGVKNVDSLVVSGNVATVTINSGHSFIKGCVLSISGATPAALNGEWRVTDVATTWVKFAITLANVTATGTITAKVAAAGWAKPFSATNKAAYKSTAPDATGFFLRVDNSGANDSRVVGYENMTDIDTGTGPFPTNTQAAGGLFWCQSNASTGTAKAWAVVADERFFFLWLCPGSQTLQSQGSIACFGDINKLAPGDSYACALHGYPSAQSGLSLYNSNDISITGSSVQVYFARSFTGLGAAVGPNMAVGGTHPSGHFSGDGPLALPNGPDNAIFFARRGILEGANLRGELPGLLHSSQSFGSAYQSFDVITGLADLAGKDVLVLRRGAPGGVAGDAGSKAYFFFDASGPWRV